MIRPRWLAQLWANLNGYFWLPCPVCGDHFGGFECGRWSLPSGGTGGSGRCVCRKSGCQSFAQRRMRAAFGRFV